MSRNGKVLPAPVEAPVDLLQASLNRELQGLVGQIQGVFNRLYMLEQENAALRAQVSTE